MRCITYEQFGAKADGVTDDMPAIIAAHNYANEHNLPVRTAADDRTATPPCSMPAAMKITISAIPVPCPTPSRWKTSRWTHRHGTGL